MSVVERSRADRKHPRAIWLLGLCPLTVLLLLLATAPLFQRTLSLGLLGLGAGIDARSRLPRGANYNEGTFAWQGGRVRTLRVYAVRIGNWYWLAEVTW